MLVSDIDAGTSISFRSKNANDPTVYEGTLEIAKATYTAIRAWMSPAAYNEAVRQTDATVSSDITTLHYFLITILNDATQPVQAAFAQEWIADGSLSILNLGNQVTVLVDDPQSNSQAIVSLLASAGYACRIVSQ